MSADPLFGLLPGVEHHATDDATAVHHEAVAEPPPADHHVLQSPDFWIDPDDLADFDDAFDQVDQLLSEAHNLTGWFNVQSNYGFTGRGQTVAVIDSGIAWDHFALGGGLGQGYRVVGGWDFTEENDANPYDDGPSGSHGTHVSGIVGSSSSTHTGVAPAVDFVGLRVFNDAGQGFFSWIENALRWIHDNRNAFANPITAVNLSLGTASWNAATIPAWANLEDEFAQLEADGIFIAVSAGNAYGSYNAPGLSYPAASPYVVPVMSTNDAGLMSTYSQRLARAIAAPGQSIVSTAPDYAGNFNGAGDDFVSKSGTSMAAPYVAGASVLIRQAMQFVGRTGVNQDMIYDHMMATADSFFDSASNQTYKRLNLGRAIDSLMPADDYGSTQATAHDLGTIASTASLTGAVGKLTDVDFFRFTAGVTGTVTFETSNRTHDMTPSWQVYGAAPIASAPGTLSFQVAAGQSYTVSLASPTGMGGYTLSAAAQASFSFVDWGAVAYNQFGDVAVAGETWYRVQATRTGTLTVQGLFNAAAGSIDAAIYDANLQLVAAGGTAAGQARVDAAAVAGGQYYVRIAGSSSDVDFKLLNLVSRVGSTVSASGAGGDDSFTFVAGASPVLSINGVSYGFDLASANQFELDGGGGTDSLVVFGSSSDETFKLRVGSAAVTAWNYGVTAASVEYVTVHSGGGVDKAILYDSAANDVFEAWTDRAQMSGAGYQTLAHGFSQYYGYASAGYDRSIIHDSAGNDTYESRWDRATMTGAGYLAYAYGFDEFEGLATSGADRVIMYDSSGDDVFEARTDRATMSGAGYVSRAIGFDESYGYASMGADQAIIRDSVGDDTFETRWDRATMRGAGYLAYAHGFDRFDGYSTVGADRVIMYDSAGNDVYEAWSDHSQMSTGASQAHAYGFNQTYGYASTGNDRAIVHDSAGDDTYKTYFDRVTMRGGVYLAYAYGFDRFDGHASAGVDRAILYDAAGDELYEAWPDVARMTGSNFAAYAFGFEQTYGYASSGFDRALMYDSAGDDEYRAWSDRVMMKGAGYLSYAYFFDQTSGFASGGFDRVILNDSTGDDFFQSWMNRVQLEGAGYRSYAEGFEQSFAYASSGYDRAAFYDSSGNDALTVRSWGASLKNGAHHTQAQYFDELAAYAVNGGDDAADVVAVDYIYDQFGDWS